MCRQKDELRVWLVAIPLYYKTRFKCPEFVEMFPPAVSDGEGWCANALDAKAANTINVAVILFMLILCFCVEELWQISVSDMLAGIQQFFY